MIKKAFFPPSSLLNIFYQLTKFEATRYKMFRYTIITSSHCPNLQMTIAKTNKKPLFKFSPGLSTDNV